MSAQVLAALNLQPTLQQVTHGRALVVTVFEHQPCPRVEVLRGCGDNLANIIVQPVGARHQRTFGFETHVAFS